MKTFGIAASALVLALAVGTPAMAATPQQEKMQACNADATGKGLKGDERKSFMSSCLSNKPAAAATAKTMTPQQERMKKCNADATGKTGDDRKAFMSACLKG
ncbi:hypothetical protein J2847_001989 [Azospirillum agricola]|uniref:PsiF family protein n=1 Tax=Azospirillum agricola TaxID=1720247 RepID=UPI001AE43F77|nr:PsiF family protein [Azospirillum agricola]MBP2228698.1 hypothetical protein [Azospirillum agricola]